MRMKNAHTVLTDALLEKLAQEYRAGKHNMTFDQYCRNRIEWIENSNRRELLEAIKAERGL